MYYSKNPEEVRNCFWISRKKVQPEQKTKTDQKTLVPENVEKAPWFLSSVNFPPKMGKRFGTF